MDDAFRTLLSTRLTELTADLRFLHKPTGDMVALKIVETMLPKKPSGYKEGQDFPVVLWTIHKGGFDARRPAPFDLIIQGIIATSGDIVNGSRDIATLNMALGKIVKKCAFPPYKLRTPVEFFYGSQDRGQEGVQPHPYYYVHLKLQFLVP